MITVLLIVVVYRRGYMKKCKNMKMSFRNLTQIL